MSKRPKGRETCQWCGSPSIKVVNCDEDEEGFYLSYECCECEGEDAEFIAKSELTDEDYIEIEGY